MWAFVGGLARQRIGPLLAGVAATMAFRFTAALVPAAVGHAIDAVAAKDTAGLVGWSMSLLGLGAAQAGSGLIRHRTTTHNWLASVHLLTRLVVRQVTVLGAGLREKAPTGEVLTITTSDVNKIGDVLELPARVAGATVSLVTVSVILLRTSLTLGLLVIVGAPVLIAATAPLLRALHRRQHDHRTRLSGLVAGAVDIVTGLRALRGIGGEAFFAARYAGESQAVRQAAVRVAGVQSGLGAVQILLPGLLVVGITWVGADQVMRGVISAGAFITLYGYAAVLVAPLRTLMETVERVVEGRVATQRVLAFLSLVPDPDGEGSPAGMLRDEGSGVVIRPGASTAIVSGATDEAAEIADRLGHYRPGEVFAGDAPLAALSRSSIRRHILVCRDDDRLFSGVLGEELDVRGTASPADLDAALHAACAQDVIDALPEGLSTVISAGGLEFSGGQRQRLRLARALLAEPETLILVEPTGAVDAHTEALIAARVFKARAGRTTVVCTSSVLVLDRVDHVIYLEGGAVMAEGPHRALLADCSAYRDVVARNSG